MSQTLRNLQKSRQGTPANAVSFPVMPNSSRAKSPVRRPGAISARIVSSGGADRLRLNPKLADVDPQRSVSLPSSSPASSASKSA
ncbi:MAG: hypothetical protein IPJ27_23970 [Candidatus Accumulibacter sp.]|uniref:Uncharacterized protein n=1 Tax=Candidatus Accumulibacter proximus TaxID=2954385 RepID=A0A935Q3L8_9PROT|nr:hypothetical protein [Candidatus Accumulibacter proximus]